MLQTLHDCLAKHYATLSGYITLPAPYPRALVIPLVAGDRRLRWRVADWRFGVRSSQELNRYHNILHG